MSDQKPSYNNIIVTDEVLEFPDSLDDSKALKETFEKRRKTARGKGESIA